MGREAARVLLAQIGEQPLKPAAREIFPPLLLIRQFTAPPPVTAESRTA